MAISKKPLAAALGAAFLATSIAPFVSAEANPFSAQQLSGGYDLANFAHHEGAEGEADKAEGEGKCGEGNCGDKKAEGAADGAAEGTADGAAEGTADGEVKAEGEGKCGEGKCGGS